MNNYITHVCNYSQHQLYSEVHIHANHALSEISMYSVIRDCRILQFSNIAYLKMSLLSCLKSTCTNGLPAVLRQPHTKAIASIFGGGVINREIIVAMKYGTKVMAFIIKIPITSLFFDE